MRTYRAPSLAQGASFADLPLTDPAVTDGRVTIMHVFESDVISGTVKNEDATNAIDWQLLGSNDQQAAVADWSVEDSGAAIAAGAVDHFKLVPYFLFYRLQAKINAAGTPAVSADLCVK